MPAFSDPNSLENLRKQYDDLTAQVRAGSGGGGYDSRYSDLVARQREAMNRLNQASSASASGATGAQDELAKSRQKILDFTSGRGDAVMGDAMTNAALARLEGVSKGTDAPFTQAVQNQQLAQQAGMSATAAGSQGEMLRMQAAGLGGSVADPSYQARLRQIESQRQSSNANAQGQIQTNAQLQNFGARQTGTNSLLSGRMGQLGMANSQYNQAADFLSRDSQTGPHQSMVQQPYMYNFAGSQNPAAGYNYQTPPIQYQLMGQQPAAQKPATNAPGTPAPTPQIQPVLHTDTGGYQYPQAQPAGYNVAANYGGTMQPPGVLPQRPPLYNFSLPSQIY